MTHAEREQLAAHAEKMRGYCLMVAADDVLALLARVGRLTAAVAAVRLTVAPILAAFRQAVVPDGQRVEVGNFTEEQLDAALDAMAAYTPRSPSTRAREVG